MRAVVRRSVRIRFVTVLLVCATLVACEREQGPQRHEMRTEQWGAAAEVTRAELAALRGDDAAMRAHAAAVATHVAWSVRIPDPARRIDPEAARAAVRSLQGVRSAVWMDAANLIVMVDGARFRTMTTIDVVCKTLDPLGDTLAVVVNVQDVTAQSTDGATTLSRNCQLPEGERALLQPKRQVDVVSPELRAAFKAQQSGRR